MSSKLSRYLPKRPTTFAFNYGPTYKTFVTNRIIDDPTHPLYIARSRIHRERPKTGLWWHATVGSTSSRSSVVRTWMNRRLRNAFLEELKARGIAEDGKILKNVKRSKTSDVIENLVKRDQDTSLTGSLKIHVMPPLLTAKYTQVRTETGILIDALLMSLEADLKGHAVKRTTRKTDGVPRSQSQRGRGPQRFTQPKPRGPLKTAAPADLART